MDRKISASEGARTSTNIIVADIVRVTASETQTITSRKLGRGHDDVDGFTLGLQLTETLFFLDIILFRWSILIHSMSASFVFNFKFLCVIQIELTEASNKWKRTINYSRTNKKIQVLLGSSKHVYIADVTANIVRERNFEGIVTPKDTRNEWFFLVNRVRFLFYTLFDIFMYMHKLTRHESCIIFFVSKAIVIGWKVIIIGE